MGNIRKLPEEIINLIAAGEVIERPASIVKELVENSIDAGADKIVVKIENGGLEGIIVEDNGSGMDAADALLAFTQHATSKVYGEEDLKDIGTLGFRGEALASISAVANVELNTMMQNGSPTKIKASQSTIEHLDGTRTVTGTTITISGLFKSIPARKKFLKSESTEFRHIQDLLQSIALTRLDTHFELFNEHKLVFRLPKTTDFTARIYDLWGGTISKNLYHLDTELNRMKLLAFLGKPDVGRRDRTKQYIFINGRAVSDRVVQRAISEAYKGFLHRDLNPVYFLFLQLPGSEVDVNVHPRKLEVRFRDSGSVYRLVYNAIRGTLEGKTQNDLRERIAYAKSPSGALGGSFNSPNQPATANFSSPSRSSVEHSLNFTKELLSQRDVQLEKSVPETSDEPMVGIDPFQIFNTYIVYQNGDELIFIDQHAAAESIQYERLLASTDVSRSKPKLVPEVIEMDKNLKRLVLEYSERLEEFGLEVEDFGGDSIQVSATPEPLNNFNAKGFLEEYAAKLADFDEISPGDEKEAVTKNLEIHNPKLHTLIATLACHGSIRAGQRLSKPEMLQIIKDLRAGSNTYNCPHGRPVTWVMRQYDLEKHFNRVVS